MDFSSFIEEGMAMIYEVRPDGSKQARWDIKLGTSSLQDYGYSDEYAACFVELIAEQKTDTHRNTAAYVRLGDGSLYAIAYPDHVHYDPKQWELPGFFHPPGGWGKFLENKGILECSCGAAGWAKRTNQPCPGHGPLCRISQLK